jgi:hypothetical protein
LSDFERQRSGCVLEQHDDRDELGGDIAVDVSQNTQKSSHLPLAIVLFVFCLSVYMLTYVGKLTSADEISMLATAKSLTQHGSFTSDQLLWTFWEFGWQAQGNLGADGHLYSKKGIGVPLLLWPLMQLSRRIPNMGSVSAAMLLNPIICALIAVAVFATASRRGYPEKTAFMLAAFGGVGTIIWPYSKTVFGEPASALFLVTAVYFISGRLSAGNGILAGLMLGCAIMVKMTNAIMLPIFAGYAIYRQRRVQHIHDVHGLLKMLAGLCAMPTVGVALTAVLSQYRFGTWFSTGYTERETFTNPLLSGLGDLLFSADESIFVFSPLLILAAIGLPLSWRRARSQTLLLVGLIIVHLLLSAGWYDWRGGLAWGPRFLVPLTPCLLLLMLPLMHDWLFIRRRWRRVLLIGLATLSIGVQIVGALTPYLEVDTPWPILSALAWLGRSPLSALDVAWLQAPGHIDWPIALLFVGLALLSLILASFMLHIAPRKSPILVWIGLAGLVVCLMGTFWGAGRPHLDWRMPAGKDYDSLLGRLTRVASPDDAVITDNHARTEYFLNQDQSSAHQYGFLRSETLRPEAESTLRTLVQAAGHIWLISDRPVGAPVSKPEEAWLNQNTFRVGEEDFSEYARLIHYYEPPAGQMKDQEETAAFGESLVLAGYQLAKGASWRAGDVLNLALEWRLERPLAGATTSSVQLLRPDGSLIWQRDLPLSLSRVGESIIVRYGIPLPIEGPAGQYVLQLVVYDPATGRRISVKVPAAGSEKDALILATPAVQTQR